MADRLQVDFDALAHARGELASIKTSLSDTVELSATMAHHTGHAALGTAIVYFAQRWSIHRGDMIDAVEAVRGSLQKVHDELSKTDQQLADALTGDPGTP